MPTISGVKIVKKFTIKTLSKNAGVRGGCAKKLENPL